MPNAPKPRILVADDEEYHRSTIAKIIEASGFLVETAQDGEAALDMLASSSFDAIVTDLMMPRCDGFQLLRTLLDRGDVTPAIVMTGFGDIDHAIRIIHELRAFWFLEKPVQASALTALLNRAVQQKTLVKETERLQMLLGRQGVFVDMVGASACMQEVYSLIQRVAPSSAPVLITGETGTGKELAAQAIHKLSRRANGPFVAINCAALPDTLIESELFGHERGAFTGALVRHPGCFEQAQGGTLFLDEIGEMPIVTQAKLLRVLQESKVRRLGGTAEIPVDARIVAATNRATRVAIQDQRLREDLYYRLSVFEVALPPLRERREDIPAISLSIIRDLNEKNGLDVAGIDPSVLHQMQSYAWPGNIRELRNFLERAVITAKEGLLRTNHFPAALGAFPKTAPPKESAGGGSTFTHPANASLDEIEKAYIQHTLRLVGNNRRQAAKILGIAEKTLYNHALEWAQQEKASEQASAAVASD